MDARIRWMIRRDMPEILNIEKQCFSLSWSEPRSEEDFIRCLRQRNCIGMSAIKEERVVGYMIYELQKKSLMILNFAVMPDYQRCGIGTQMIAKLTAKLSHERRQRIFADVCEDNLIGHLFFKKKGFTATHVTRNFYENDHDSYHFKYDLYNHNDLIAIFKERQQQFNLFL